METIKKLWMPRIFTLADILDEKSLKILLSFK